MKYLEETILIVSAAWMLIYFFYPAGSRLLQLALWAIPFAIICTAILMIVVKRKRERAGSKAVQGNPSQYGNVSVKYRNVSTNPE
ncbi:hypothetical protein C772_02674 [Bhargavaea cecembensis DSE10]|uniref:Uncharacterized protein n=1 Tax=Bhargavaea cecembensis DSE10 TaxID=1235279 RepID=M7N9S7_9BACL|nr:hypothetical protein [Bhargavaea cecembensis]EMR05323.1 hypothetical protein C772_02674 [Bhargavaea cecembensis DSE10]